MKAIYLILRLNQEKEICAKNYLGRPTSDLNDLFVTNDSNTES